MVYTPISKAYEIISQMSTIKQKLAASKLVENGGNMGKAMVSAGYSPMTAKTPQKLTESRGWKELMDKYLPDEELLRAHKQGLKATTLKPHLIDRDNKGRPIYDYVKEDDMPTRKQYLDLAYRVKRKFVDNQTFNQFNIEDVTWGDGTKI